MNELTPKDTHGYTVEWSGEDQLFVARILEMNWVTGHGDTREAAIEMVEDNFHEALLFIAEAPPAALPLPAPIQPTISDHLENQLVARLERMEEEIPGPFPASAPIEEAMERCSDCPRLWDTEGPVCNECPPLASAKATRNPLDDMDDPASMEGSYSPQFAAPKVKLPAPKDAHRFESKSQGALCSLCDKPWFHSSHPEPKLPAPAGQSDHGPRQAVPFMPSQLSDEQVFCKVHEDARCVQIVRGKWNVVYGDDPDRIGYANIVEPAQPTQVQAWRMAVSKLQIVDGREEMEHKVSYVRNRISGISTAACVCGWFFESNNAERTEESGDEHVAAPKVAETQPAIERECVFCGFRWCPKNDHEPCPYDDEHHRAKPETQPVSQELEFAKNLVKQWSNVAQPDMSSDLRQAVGIMEHELAKLKSVDAESAEEAFKRGQELMRLLLSIAFDHRINWDKGEMGETMKSYSAAPYAAPLAGRGDNTNDR